MNARQSARTSGATRVSVKSRCIGSGPACLQDWRAELRCAFDEWQRLGTPILPNTQACGLSSELGGTSAHEPTAVLATPKRDKSK
jgi:hypothetical protein